MTQYKLYYQELLEDGMLFEWMPDATGEWEKDKKIFIELQQELKNSLTLDVIDAEEIDND